MKYALDDKSVEDLEEKLNNCGCDDPNEFALPGTTLLAIKDCNDLDTKECKNLLNEYKKGEWKRIWKKSFKTSAHEPNATYRGFQSETGEIVTVAHYGSGWFSGSKAFIYNFNLKDSFDEIKQIVDHIKAHYVGCDYSEILYNPVTKYVWLPMGDCGSFAVENMDELDGLDSEDYEAIEALMENDDNDKYCPSKAFDFVVETLYSDECYPGAAHGYIPVGYYREM